MSLMAKKINVALAISMSLAAAAFMPNAAQAQNAAPKAVIDKVNDSSNLFLTDGQKILSVKDTPVSGIYEIQVDNKLVYTNANVDHLLTGSIISLKTGTNLTRERLDDINRVDFNTLPLEHALKFVNGNGKRKLAIFSDPNCGFCKKLEGYINDVPNSTIYIFAYPILSNDSVFKTQMIWCDKDPKKAWHDWMIKGITPGKGTDYGKCNNASVATGYELGKKLGVTGTPAIFTEDGKKLDGAQPLDVIKKAVDEAEKRMKK